jgi:uncharacterized protein
MLRDVLSRVRWLENSRPFLVFDGDASGFAWSGLEVRRQRLGTLADRLAATVIDCGVPAEPLLIIGMDSPEITTRLLGESLEQLATPDVDAVLGPTRDGGYWAIGMKRPDPSVFHNVPMSTSRTFAAQLSALEARGLSTRLIPELSDVDVFSDALEVADRIPESSFAHAVEAVRRGIEVSA